MRNGLAFLNPAAFSTPAPVAFGNLGRSQLRGPNFVQSDFTIANYIPVTETAQLEFRTEFFNLFNHPNFANPPATLAAGSQPNQPFSAGGTFGVLNSTVTKTVGLGTNRQIQFALKLNF